MSQPNESKRHRLRSTTDICSPTDLYDYRPCCLSRSCVSPLPSLISSSEQLSGEAPATETDNSSAQSTHNKKKHPPAAGGSKEGTHASGFSPAAAGASVVGVGTRLPPAAVTYITLRGVSSCTTSPLHMTLWRAPAASGAQEGRSTPTRSER